MNQERRKTTESQSWGAIPPHAELSVARVLTFGAEKYARDGWQVVENAEVRYMDAALRHLNAHRRGDLVDDESGESHLAHAACCILFMLDMQEREGDKNE
ncbi:MAG: dATP/dGTP diphosphohydrolase domain-containing protein [Plesiomonas shigelloides]